MKQPRTKKDLILKGEDYFLPQLSVDCVIFGFHEGVLKVLLIRLAPLPQWGLVGGFILKEENPDAAAHRILKERTGLDEIFLQFLQVFGNPDRTKTDTWPVLIGKLGVKAGTNNWLLKRFVSLGYYALVDFHEVTPGTDGSFESCVWFDIHEIPALLFDHREILDQALETLQLHLNYHPVGYNLLPVSFTMPELQRLYETILDKKLDRRNFQRKILSFGILRRLKEKRKGVAHKAPYLYSFDLRKYNKALKEGLGGGW